MDNKVFNDAPMIAEIALRDQYSKVVGDRMLYMAICSALVRKLGNDVEIPQKELLLDATIHINMNAERNTFIVSVEGQKLIEETDGQRELPFDG